MNATERLRVLEVSPSSQVWGAELATLDLVEPLARRGIDVSLAAPTGGAFADTWVARGYRHVPLPAPERRGLRAAGDRRAGFRQLADELRASTRSVATIARLAAAADLLHTSSLWLHLDAAVAGRLARRPVVLELCDLVRPGVGRRVLTSAMALSAASTTISRATAACIGPAGRRRLHLVPPAVDLRRFAPGPPDPTVRARLAADPAAPLVGIIGRIDPSKGVHLVVDAVAALPPRLSAAQLVVVGTPGLDAGGYLDDVRRRAGELLGPRVRFLGRSDDVPSVVRALDVLVNASTAEPFGLTALEAQASGVAVVATAAGGIVDFVVDRQTGLLVPPGDAAALARALAGLLGDVDLRLAMVRRARAVAVSAYGLEARADTVAGVYRVAARRGHHRAPEGRRSTCAC